MTTYVHYRQQSSVPLPSITVELTERCNNDCLHCCINLPAGDSEARRRELNTAQVQEILRQAADLGYGQVHLTGGEPLLRLDFEAIYLFARRLGLDVLLFTNGRLITTHLADLFAHIPPRVPIEITVYGMHAESYDAATRAPGAFAQFMRGVQRLWERKVPFVVKSAVLPSNRDEMDEFEAGPPGIPWKVTKPTYSLNFDLRSRRDNSERNRQIVAVRTPPRESIAIVMRDATRFHPWTETLATKKLHPFGDRLFRCGACEGKTTCVDAYGVAQPCISLRAPGMTYALFGESVETGHQEATAQKIANPTAPLKLAIEHFTQFGELRASNPEYLRRCARCFLKGICEQCPAKAWAEHGSFDTPVEYLCEMTHTWARHLGWLNEKEHGWEISGWQGRIPPVGQ
ncbi:Radical SAM domain-containing protein [Gammaproteobacteria bacterium]